MQQFSVCSAMLCTSYLTIFERGKIGKFGKLPVVCQILPSNFYISWHIIKSANKQESAQVFDEKFTVVSFAKNLHYLVFYVKLSRLKQHNFSFTWQLYSDIHKLKRCSVTSTLSGYTMNSDANITVCIMRSDQYILIMGNYFQIKMISANILSKTKPSLSRVWCALY